MGSDEHGDILTCALVLFLVLRASKGEKIERLYFSVSSFLGPIVHGDYGGIMLRGMSRPPESLSKEDIKRVADVRRDVWNGGWKGGALGMLGGIVGWPVLRRGLPSTMQRTYSHSKYYTLAVFATGALGSFLGSVTAGKNSVQLIGDVFEKGAKLSPYRQQMALKQQELDESFQRRRQLLMQRRVSKSEEVGRDGGAPPRSF